MKPFVKALRELGRIANRQTQRLLLIFERRKLARLETALGLLGWQQAEYDAATQAHVDRLTDYEREQSRLTNESAALGLEIQEFEKRRGVAQREFAEAQAAALEKEHPSAGTPEALAERAAEWRRKRKAIEARLPVLDREIAVAEEQYRALVVPALPSDDVQAELLRLRKLILALPREKAEWQARLEEKDNEITSIETLLQALRDARADFEKRDQGLAREIDSRLRAKRQVEKQSEALEKSKTHPYREIGRALADHQVAPLNQPDALTAVMDQRRVIMDREASIAASLAESARDGWGTGPRS